MEKCGLSGGLLDIGTESYPYVMLVSTSAANQQSKLRRIRYTDSTDGKRGQFRNSPIPHLWLGCSFLCSSSLAQFILTVVPTVVLVIV